MANKSLDVLVYVPYKEVELGKLEKQWITNLRHILEISLSQLVKQKINCELSYFETNLHKADVYIQCLFGESLEPKNNLQEISKELGLNVFHVFTSPKQKKSLNGVIRIKDYHFYSDQSGKIFDLTSDLNDILDTTWLNISDLTFEVCKILKEKKDKSKNRNVIFIAETSPDQVLNRNYLIREFKHLGYDVVPEHPLPTDVIGYSERVQKLMEESIISVHLIGNTYAPLLNTIDVSKVELQNDIFNEVIAKANAENRDLQRLILIPPGLKPKSDKQKKYIQSIKRNIELQQSTEIIQTPLEDFKTIIQKKISEVNKKSEKLMVDTSKKTFDQTIYLISNGHKGDAYKLLKKMFESKRIECVETQVSKNKIELIKQHHRNLEKCDGVVVYYSVENGQWLNSKLSDIVKSPGKGRNRPFLVKSIVIDGVKEPDLRMHVDDLTIVNTKKKEHLNLLLEKIK